MKVKSEGEVTQSCLTLRDPMDCSLLGSSAHWIFQARVLEWVAIALSEIIISRHIKCLNPLHPDYQGAKKKHNEFNFNTTLSKRGYGNLRGLS